MSSLIKLESFHLQWPSFAWLLWILPLLIAGYWRARARQLQRSQRFPNLTLGSVDDRKRSFLRRHLPALLILIGLAALLFATARPQAVVALSSPVASVVLAIDISGSMRATDVKPNRMQAAKEAAKAFVADQPEQMKVGVVSIAGTAALVQSPTRARTDVIQAIDRLQSQPGTAIGSGLIASLVALLPQADITRQDLTQRQSADERRSNPVIGEYKRQGSERFERLEPDPLRKTGANTALAIVLLTDGQNNTGPDIAKAIHLANQQGVRIYTVGIGTVEGTTVAIDGWSMRVRLDEEGLKQIATETGAEYFSAANASDLKKVYQFVGAKLALGPHETTELTAIFALIGVLFTVAGALICLREFNRLI